MGQLILPLQIAGTILGTAGAIQAGRSANAVAQFEARQLESQATAERATASREAAEEKRKARLVASRARAVGAASGGGVDLELQGDIEAEGDYRSLTAIWAGEERARGRELQAEARRFEGTQAARAGVLEGVSTLLSGAGQSLMQRYG